MNFSPSLQVAHHLIRRAEDDCYAMSPFKLNLLTYICHGWMLATHALPLCLTPVVARRYGPYLPEIAGVSPAEALMHYDSGSDESMDPREAAIADEVYAGYGGFSDVELIQITREKGSPWRTVWAQDTSGEAVIDDELIQDHYANFTQRYDAATTISL